MIQTRPVSDLRNNLSDIEKIIYNGEPVCLAKNGHGAMVVLSLDMYCQLTDNVEMALTIADQAAEKSNQKLTHAEVFENLRNKINSQ